MLREILHNWWNAVKAGPSVSDLNLIWHMSKSVLLARLADNPWPI